MRKRKILCRCASSPLPVVQIWSTSVKVQVSFWPKKLFSALQPGESVLRSYKYYIRQIGQIILTTESVDAGDILLNNIPLPYRKRSNNNQLFVARKNIKAQSTDLLQRLQPLELASSTSDDLLSTIFTSGQYLSTIYALFPAGLHFPIVQTLHTNKYYAALKCQQQFYNRKFTSQFNAFSCITWL